MKIKNHSSDTSLKIPMPDHWPKPILPNIQKVKIPEWIGSCILGNYKYGQLLHCLWWLASGHVIKGLPPQFICSTGIIQKAFGRSPMTTITQITELKKAGLIGYEYHPFFRSENDRPRLFSLEPNQFGLNPCGTKVKYTYLPSSVRAKNLTEILDEIESLYRQIDGYERGLNPKADSGQWGLN